MAEKVDMSDGKLKKSSFCTPTSENRQISRTRLRQPFKSPVLKSDKSSEGCDEPQGTYIDVLKEKIAKIDKEIDELGIEYSEDELQIHIDKLHEYNEIKDTGQLLLGKIAEIEGKTTKMMYEEYGLDIED